MNLNFISRYQTNKQKPCENHTNFADTVDSLHYKQNITLKKNIKIITARKT